MVRRMRFMRSGDFTEQAARRQRQKLTTGDIFFLVAGFRRPELSASRTVYPAGCITAWA